MIEQIDQVATEQKQSEGQILQPTPSNTSTEMFSQEPERKKIIPRILLVALVIGLLLAAPRIAGFVHRVYSLIVGSN